MKRFYKTAAAGEHEGGLAVLLDGRPVRTPERRLLHLPSRPLADAIAAEWQAQGETLDIASMGLTQLASTALDRVAPQRSTIAGEVAKYAETDLLCYRADRPDSLVEAQHATWQPLLDWAESDLGARLVTTAGIQPIPQAEAALQRLRLIVDQYDAFALAAISSATAVSGSLIVALALANGRLTAEEAAKAAHIDERHQMELWGHDEEAEARLSRHFGELKSVERFLALLYSA